MSLLRSTRRQCLRRGVRLHSPSVRWASGLSEPSQRSSKSKWARPESLPERRTRTDRDPSPRHRFDSGQDTPSRHYIPRDTSIAGRGRRPPPRRHNSRRTDDDLDVPTITTPQRRRAPPAPRAKSKLYIPPSVTVSNLSRLLGVRLEALQSKMREAGFDEVAHDVLLTSDLASLVAEEFDHEPVVDETSSFDLYPRPPPADSSSLPLRTPLVTIMGHVDHGKTTLLDTLRKASVAAGEAGGITQHIGAFSVLLPSNGRAITFLDTPGHAAFEAMRRRGADVTDMVVLVVAADDSVMPQTREAIKHARAADVGLVVAVNKCDKPGVTAKQIDRVKRDLLSEGVELEEFGGEVQCVEVSGLTGKGLDALEEAILGLAEVMDIRSDPAGPAEGWVLESSVKRGRGNTASVVVRRGTLSRGGFVVAGRAWCRIKAMSDEAGRALTSAGPGTPVEVTGWSELPEAGDEMLGGASEKECKQVVANRKLRQEQAQQLRDVEAINEKRARERESDADAAAAPAEADGPIKVPMLVKADVSGSAEAIRDSIQALSTVRIEPLFVDVQVGPVTESDILRATSAEAVVVAFNVGFDSRRTEQLASRAGIAVLSDAVIYRLIDGARSSMAQRLPAVTECRVTGEAEVVKAFAITVKQPSSSVPSTVSIAGCRITNGAVDRSHSIRIIRPFDADREAPAGGYRDSGDSLQAGDVTSRGRVVYAGALSSLRHVKEEVARLNRGSECGMGFGPPAFEDFRPGDLVQCVVEEKRAPRSL